MTHEEYQRIKDIFHAVVDLTPAERSAFLQANYGSQPQIRSEVEKLLGSLESDFLDRPAVETLAADIVGGGHATGEMVGHYRIIKHIGSGGMGEIFLAEDVGLGRRAALKFLTAGLAEDEEHLHRFLREAKAVSALNHPNIMTVYEIGEVGDSRFIAAEYIRGVNLRQHIDGKPLDPREALRIASQIAAGLEAAHEAGIMHRDIKPDNIMIRDDGLVKILDFGAAKRELQAGGGSHLTEPGKVIGTIAYMSPEQTQWKTVDTRTDLWSLGVVLSEMLTGNQPFDGQSKADTIALILTEDPPALDESIPGQVRQIVAKCLEKKTDKRYQSATELLHDLKTFEHDVESSAAVENWVDSLQNIAAESVVERRSVSTGEQKLRTTHARLPYFSAEYIVTQVKHHKFFYLTLAVFVTTGIGFGIYRYRGIQPTNIPFESVKITKVTDSGKVGDRVALSRDGKWLAYSILEGGKASLWLKQVAVPDSNTQIMPPADIYYREISFSPDANYLYYSVLEGTGNQMTVYQMPVLGGGTTRKFLSGINGEINFSPDGKQITYGVEDLQTDESILMIADADGTNPRQLVKMKGNDEIASSRGRWSPDGKSIALWVGTNNPKTQELAAVSVATGEITRLKTHKFSEFALWDWLADGKGFVVLAREKPAQNNSFWRISLPSGEAQKITNDLDGYFSLSLSADSSIMATVRGSRTSHLWTAPAGDTAQATQVTSGSNEDIDPQWTPDGKLVFERAPGYICIVNPRGGNPQRLTTNLDNRFPRVSRDGRYIVYVSYQNGTPTIWRMDIDGGNPKQLTTEFSVEPSISPDGREVIYSVGVDSSRIWKVGIDGGQPVQLTDKQSRNAVFSPDGKQVACNWWDEPNSPPKIAIFPATGGNPVKTFAFNGEGLRWMPDGRSFVYLDTKNGVRNFWSQPIDGGTPKQLTNSTGERIWSANLSPDGKQIAVSRGTGSSDVVLITGFRK